MKHECIELMKHCGFVLIGHFLGIVTRRPLVLQLHKIEGGAEYAEFLHAPKKRLMDFGMLEFSNLGIFTDFDLS